jgi:predicted nucleic acid-binding protein
VALVLIQPSTLHVVDAGRRRHDKRLMHRESEACFEDAMIAAIAQTNGLIVPTRNVKDFAAFGVRTFDPFGVAT